MKLSYKELDSLIDDLIEREKYMNAIHLAKAFINNAEEERNDSLRAYGLNSLGILNQRIGKFNESLTLFLKAKSIRERVFGKEHPEYAQSLNNLAELYVKSGNYNQALELHLKAGNIRKKVLGKEHILYANSLNNLGYLHEKMGNYSQALAVHLKAKDIIEKALGKEHPKYASSISNLALLYEKMGNYSEALQLYLRAKDILGKKLGKEHLKYASSLNNLAGLHEIMGNYDQALPLYLQVKDISEKVLGKEHLNYAITLNNLAFLHERMTNNNKALSLYIQAKDIMKRTLGKEHPFYATSLNNLAGLYTTMGNYSKALMLYLQAKDIREGVLGKEHPSYSTSLNNLAFLHEKMGNYNQALPLYLEASEIDQKVLGKEHPHYIVSLNNLSILYQLMGNYNQAWKVLSKAMNNTTRTQLYIDFDTVWSDRLQAASYPSNAHLKNVIKSLDIAYNLLEKDNNVTDSQTKQSIVADLANKLLIKARNRVSSEQDKLRILSLSHEWLQRSLRILNPEIHNNKAFNLSDQNKSVLLLEATKSELAYQLGDLPDSLVLKDRNLLKKRSILQARLIEKGSELEKDSLRNELNSINHEIIEFVRTIEREYPKYHKIKYQQIDAKVEDVQASLDGNTALLEYVVGDSVLHIFYVDKEQVQWSKSFVTDSVLKDRIQSFHLLLSDHPLNKSNKALKQSYQDYKEHAHWFYQKLVTPVLEDKSEIDNLIIITDGELGHLPFETFLIEKSSDELIDYNSLHYLLNDYNISYNYSATLWKENIEAPLPQNNGQILAMAANYDFTLDSSMISVRLPTDQWKRGDISPLPSARKEVEILKGKYEGFFAFDSLASEKTVKKMAPGFSVLHFATHGILDKERPVLSSLTFTEDNDSTESNFWEAYEISKAQLNADLVVLSACQTGYGKFEKGNGIASLARAFMYAGVPALIVSLWQVNDRATSELMEYFYDNLDDGFKKDEALRKAKLHYIKYADGISAHPSYWAPFVAMGKTDTIDLERKGSLIIWVIGITLLFLACVSGFLLKRRIL
ncbi:MAG: CHAT domain-containing tetratricopeptide repeat protein [Bacteroidota bacterium]